MIVINDNSKCCGCEACANICPINCIHMISDTEGFLYPKVDEHLCINCHQCEKVCPISNYTTPGAGMIEAYAVKSNNIDIRLRSSSGGVFYHLTKGILDRGGVIAAPIFNESFELQHRILNDFNSLNMAIGTKYVQSRIQNIFREIKNLLQNKTIVYFAGTPCQVVALKKYLGKDYEGLVTQDLICHGVPSPGLWKRHIEYLMKEDQRIEQVDFRDKSRGWRGYSLKVKYENGHEYCEPSYKDPYLSAYSRELSSRPSCFECPFKGEHRESDITLGDFWGIENVCASMDDNKGTSLVMIHTDKGKQLLANLKEIAEIQEVNCTEALMYNKAAMISAIPSTKRAQFFADLEKNQYMTVMKKYCREGRITKFKRIVKSIIRH